ncbi:hypothetical protein [Sphingomonas xinjiangensis]|uniref:Uncharacterized protein n=1 Tax=Sphingomonas xinjiangensis TaxID=643568 RepID=A0A840YRC9_9SPHN|nr:hypothetical protein [Sphingomonas xinjiangensis]MBB5712171.1 hypothetical protein [Sphingomonas xinjiangensis]
MISLAPGKRVNLASRSVRMRLGFDGLAALFDRCSRTSLMLATSSYSAAEAATTSRRCTGLALGCACLPTDWSGAGSFGHRLSTAAWWSRRRSQRWSSRRWTGGEQLLRRHPDYGAVVRRNRGNPGIWLGANGCIWLRVHVATRPTSPNDPDALKVFIADMQAKLAASEQALAMEREAHEAIRKQVEAAQNPVKVTTWDLKSSRYSLRGCGR